MGARGDNKRQVDIKLQQRMVELKVYQCRITMAIATVGLGLVLAPNVIFIEPHRRAIRTLIFMLIVYIPCLLFTFGWLSLTSLRTDIASSVVMFAIVFTTMSMSDDSHFFLLASNRTIIRLCVSLMLLDIRKAVPLNTLVSMTICFKYTSNIGVMHASSLAINHVVGFLIMEFAVFTGVLTVTFLVQYWTEGRIRAMLEAEGARHGMHKLLNTLCDAVLNLGPELRINTPTPQFLHMLGRHHGDNDDKYEEGTAFATHIASESDQLRFHEFMSSSTYRATCCLAGDCLDNVSTEADRGLPAVLHVHLQDAKGSHFPVEIFHACLPDGEHQPGHLLGIRVVGELPLAEAPTHALDGQLQMRPVAQASSRRSPSSRRSSRSSSSWESMMTWKRTPLPELIGISLCVDALDPCLKILECTLRFVADKEGGSDDCVPGFMDWISDKPRAQQFKSLMQSYLNEAANGCSSLRNTVGPLLLQPLALAANGQFHLISNVVEFSIKDPDSDEEEPGHQESECSWPVLIELKQFSRLQQNYTRRLKKPSMYPVAEGE